MKKRIYNVSNRGVKFALFTKVPHFNKEFYYTIVDVDGDQRYVPLPDVIQYECLSNIRAYMDWCLTHYQYAATLIIKDNHGKTHEEYVLSDQDAQTNCKNFDLVQKYLEIRKKVEAVSFKNQPILHTKQRKGKTRS